MDKLSISVFAPCFNEEDNVEKLLNNMLEFIPKISGDYEIIIVDDGSTDATAEIALQLAASHPQIRVIRHKENKGYGAALRTGFENSGKDIIFFTDSDNQFDISEMTKLLPYIRDYDIVTGFRIHRRDNIIRKINEYGFNRLRRLLFGLKLGDLNCAFKMYKREVIKSISMKSNLAFINSEILIRAKKKGFTIKEVGVTHYPRKWGTQTGANLKVITGTFRELFTLRKELM
jgi:glycosyltransferase involved in cell wall biosynthesis